MPVFLTPIYLLAGLAAVIPLVLHLVHRRKPRPMQFSTLRFLRAASVRTRRARRLNRILLLAMRMMILLLLAMAFARPMLRFSGGLPHGRRTVVIVIDASASMRTLDGGEPLFEQARDWAYQVLESLEDGDRVALLAPGAERARRVFPPVSDHGRARRELESLECGFFAVDFPGELRQLTQDMERLDRDAPIVELHVFSDFQVANWRFAENGGLLEDQAEKLVVFLNRVSTEFPVNAGIVSANYHPEAVVGDGAFRVNATLRATSGYDVAPHVGLSVGDEEQHSASAALDGRVEASVTLFGRPNPGAADDVHGRITLAPDAFAEDNIHYFSLPRIDAVDVAIVDQRGGTASLSSARTAFLRRALHPGGAGSTIFKPEVLGRTVFMNSDLSEFSAVFLADFSPVDAEIVQPLRRFVEDGGLCFVFPARSDDGTTDWAMLFPDGNAPDNITIERLTVPETHVLNNGAKTTALERTVRSILPFPLRLTVERRVVMHGLPKDAVGFMEYPDGSPFMVEIEHGLGRFWLVSVAPDREWSNWVLSPLFVVGIQEALRSGLEESRGAREAVVGRRPTLVWPAPVKEVSAVWTPPDAPGRTLILTRQELARPFELPVVARPGFHHLSVGERRFVYAVNLDPDEMKLSYLDDHAATNAFGVGRVVMSSGWFEQEARMADMSFGRPLWPVLLMIVFILALIEILYANWLSRPHHVPSEIARLTGGIGGRG